MIRLFFFRVLLNRRNYLIQGHIRGNYPVSTTGLEMFPMTESEVKY